MEKLKFIRQILMIIALIVKIIKEIWLLFDRLT